MGATSNYTEYTINGYLVYSDARRKRNMKKVAVVTGSPAGIGEAAD
jgi:NADP-dependent 3-hydroxy acid dehydrogenase YdfG